MSRKKQFLFPGLCLVQDAFGSNPSSGDFGRWPKNPAQSLPAKRGLDGKSVDSGLVVSASNASCFVLIESGRG